MSDIVQRFQELDSTLQAAIIGGALLVIVLPVLIIILRRRKSAARPELPDLTLEIASLGSHGPPESGPQVECYNVAMRLAAVILAPAGRMGKLPPRDQWADLLDQIVPGLGEVVGAHDPLLRSWPEQLSSKGFAQQFFTNAQLPGDRGKGSPWCSLAGKIEADGDFHMAALVFRSAKPNSLGEFAMEPTDWLGVIRVRRGE